MSYKKFDISKFGQSDEFVSVENTHFLWAFQPGFRKKYDILLKRISTIRVLP